MKHLPWGLTALMVFLFGCAPELGEHCLDSCNKGLVCAAGRCVATPEDGTVSTDEGHPVADIGADSMITPSDMKMPTTDLRPNDAIVTVDGHVQLDANPDNGIGGSDGNVKDSGPARDMIVPPDQMIQPDMNNPPDLAPPPADAFIAPDANCEGGCIHQCTVQLEICDGLDNDCDELVDEDLLNACDQCGPLPQEICDGADNDCNELVDEDLQCDCDNGTNRECYSGDPLTQDIGECQAGTQNCVDSRWAECTNEVAPSSEVCDGLDNDCNEIIDDMPEIGQPCVVLQAFGVCRIGHLECMQSELVCNSNALPSAEICDNLDNNCDGQTDEMIDGCNPPPPDMAVPPEDMHVVDAITPLDAAALDAAIADVAVPDAATPDAFVCVPQAETCDGADNNCNGDTDEGFSLGTPCSAGIGACFNAGSIVCNEAGGSVCSAHPSAPSVEIFDGIDNNCNGQVDEGLNCNEALYLPVATLCGVGPCERSAMTSCQGGQIVDPCTPGQPAASDSSCNGVDDNCNGQVDEDYVPAATACGVGACAQAGQRICEAGNVVNTCEVGQPAASDASCNDVDDDCNGQVDEDYVPAATACGVGACAAVGVTSCQVGGHETDSCLAGQAAASDDSCNDVDDDCNGQVDEDYVPAATACGVGACARAGQRICEAGGHETDTCAPGSPVAELCNDIDDDCDGQINETFPTLGAPCEVGTGKGMRGGYFVCNAAGDGVICPAVPGVCAGADATAGEGAMKDDDDCNGVINDIISCSPGAEQAQCYWDHSRVAAEIRAGSPCRTGTTLCQADGNGWDPCVGLVIPHPEKCNSEDDDCDGQVDENCIP